MTDYLSESLRMIERLLSEADFGHSFPHVFGHPSDNNAKMSIRNECGLLLRKAQLHLIAVLQANSRNNLHSMAVHMRVVLECAMQVVGKANAAADGSPKAFAQVLNATEYDFTYAMARLSRGSITKKDTQETINDAREAIGERRKKTPKRLTLSDRAEALIHGSEWYEHLSKSFAHTEATALAGISYSGGVVSIDTELDELAFATLLDYLGEQVIRMLAGNGFLRIAVDGDTHPYEEAMHLLERKRESTKPYK